MAKSRSEGDRRARQIQRLGRILKVLRLIEDRHGRWDLPSLARELGCSTKTVQRDLLALEEARIPYYFDKQKCCYRISPGFRLSILNDPSKQPPQNEAVAQPTEARPLPTPVELAESSKVHAERLLSEAERLIEALSQLCQSLRQSGQIPDHRSGPMEK
jgi:predicted DNA-binding transcriptional regulator YafY